MPEPGRDATTDHPINWRKTTTGVTIYEEDEPDAWIHAEFEAGTPPELRLFMCCPNCGGISAHRTVPGHGSVCCECGSQFTHE